MIGGVDDNCVVGLSRLFEFPEQPAKFGVYAADVTVVSLKAPAQTRTDAFGVRPEFQRLGLVALLLFRWRIQEIRVRRIPGNHEHPWLASVALDEIEPFIRHQRAVVALGLDFAAGIGIEGEGPVEVLVGVRPDVPILESLPCRTGWDELAALVAGRQVPFPDIAGAV